MHAGAFEDDIVGKIKLDHARGNTQKRDTSTIAQDFEALANGLRVPRHFQHDINAQSVCDIEDLLHRINFTGIENIVCTHLRGDFQPFGIGFDGKNGTGTRYAAQANRPQANGSAAKDGYSLVRDFARKCGVNGITKGFLN